MNRKYHGQLAKTPARQQDFAWRIHAGTAIQSTKKNSTRRAKKRRMKLEYQAGKTTNAVRGIPTLTTM